MPRNLLVFAGLILSLVALSACSRAESKTIPSDLARINLPEGFSIDWYAKDVPGARMMAPGPDGVIFVGTMGGRKNKSGRFYAVVDADGDYKADKVVTIAEGQFMPNGVAYRDGSLYVAEVNKVSRYDGLTLENLETPPEPVVISEDFPSDTWHGWKFIRFGPDGKLYVPVGAPCNICEVEDPYSTIMRMNADGSDLEVYVRGVRNTVGFDWHPETGQLWFTDNGADDLGNDMPADELTRLVRTGQHFGYPYCHQGDFLDPTFGKGKSCDDYVAPARKLGPHVAAIGMRFYDGSMFPESYKGQAFIAEHGSWNRDDKIGYRVTLVRNDGRNATSYEVFADGWLDSSEDAVMGRPSDVMELPDGSLLVSDDKVGAIYRITYDGK